MLNIDFEQEDWMLEGGCVYADTDRSRGLGDVYKRQELRRKSVNLLEGITVKLV